MNPDGEEKLRLQQYYTHSRRFSGGPGYIPIRNNYYSAREKGLGAVDDYTYALNSWNLLINKPGLHNVPNYKAFRENYKLELEKSKQDMEAKANNYDLASRQVRQNINHVRSSL